MYPVIAALVAGIATLHAIPDLPPAGAPAGVLLLAVACLPWRRARAPAMAAALGFGLAWWQAHERLAQDWPCSRDRELVTLSGLVAAPATVRKGRVDFELATDAADRARGVPPGLRLAWYDATVVPQPGERWRMGVHLRCRRSLRNPGGHDRELVLLAEAIGATGYLSRRVTPRRLEPSGWRLPVEQARAWLAARIAAATAPSPSTGVVQGLAVGVRGSVSDEQRRALAATGTAHLIAISGMHVTAFALVAVALLRAGLRRWQPRGLSAYRVLAEALLVAAAAGGYTLLAGAALPALRTCAMLSMALALRAARRDPGAGRLLAAAAGVLLAADPLALLSTGFWLSFVATGALLAVAWGGRPAAGVARRYASAQSAVSLGLAPVSAVAFGGVSSVAPLANAVAIPLFSLLLLPLTLTGLALAPLWDGASRLALRAAATVLDACWPPLDWLAGLPGAMWHAPTPPAWLIVLAAVAALLCLLLPAAGLRAACLAVLAALLLRDAPAVPPGAAAVTVLDVGQGLAVVVRTASHAMLFDAGPRWRGGGSVGEVVVLPYLRHAGIRRLDLLVLSHADADHTGGVEAVVRALPVARVLRGAGEYASALPARPCQRGDAWNWDGVRCEVLHPAGGESWSDNDGSCTLRVSTAGGRALLLADVQAPAEARLAEQAIGADVALMPHHGSASSSTPALVAAVRPRWVLVSAGFGNRWGMPKPAVVERWRASGAIVCGTHESGALQFELPAAGPLRAPTGHASQSRRWWRAAAGGGSCGPAAVAGSCAGTFFRGAGQGMMPAACGKSFGPADR